MTQLPTRPPCLVIAHRGARGLAPENTIEAFIKAAEMGADAVELDVQLSADGVAVVAHDGNLLRCSDAAIRFPGRASWRVDSFTLAELKQLDAGSWFAHQLNLAGDQRQAFLATLTDEEVACWIGPAGYRKYAAGGIAIPTLLESLACCQALGMQVHVEMKSIPRAWEALPEKVLHDIDQIGMRGQTVVSSFDHRHLARFRELAQDIEIAVLSHDRLFNPKQYLASLGASTYAICCHGDYDTLGLGSAAGEPEAAMIAELREAGYKTTAWTENDPENMRRLVEAGIAGIFTDFPNRLAAILQNRPNPP